MKIWQTCTYSMHPYRINIYVSPSPWRQNQSSSHLYYPGIKMSIFSRRRGLARFWIHNSYKCTGNIAPECFSVLVLAKCPILFIFTWWHYQKRKLSINIFQSSLRSWIPRFLGKQMFGNCLKFVWVWSSFTILADLRYMLVHKNWALGFARFLRVGGKISIIWENSLVWVIFSIVKACMQPCLWYKTRATPSLLGVCIQILNC